MIDKRQVIYDIERCISHVPDACRDYSRYTGTVELGCMENLMSDALTLLKELEPKKPIGSEDPNSFRRYNCPKCGRWFEFYEPAYCDKCGQAVKWK